MRTQHMTRKPSCNPVRLVEAGFKPALGRACTELHRFRHAPAAATEIVDDAPDR